MSCMLCTSLSVQRQVCVLPTEEVRAGAGLFESGERGSWQRIWTLLQDTDITNQCHPAKHLFTRMLSLLLLQPMLTSLGTTSQSFLTALSPPGRVVNITSMLGRMVSPSRSCYCISKYGVAAFSDCLRQEMYRWGVKVILIEPSNFVAATGILTEDSIDKQAEVLWSGASNTVREDYGREYFTRHVALMKSFVNSGLKDMSLVLNDITNALVSAHPNNRYNPMETYWWMRLQVMTHLPTAVADWLYIPGATLWMAILQASFQCLYVRTV